MPYKLHHWDYGSDTSDPGWPRRYLTYDHHTACSACHEPSGLLRVLQHLFGGPATRCRHPRGRSDGGWGGDVRGFVRRKGCKNKNHHALAFRPGIGASTYPEKLKPVLGPLRNENIRTRLPKQCHERTPRGHKPSHTLLRYCGDEHNRNNGQAAPFKPPYPVSEEEEEEENEENEDSDESSPLAESHCVDPRAHQRHSHSHKQKSKAGREGHRHQGHNHSPNRRTRGKKGKGKRSKTEKTGGREDRRRHRNRRGDGRIHDPWRRSSSTNTNTNTNSTSISSADYVLQPFVVEEAAPSRTRSSSSSSSAPV